MAGSCFSYGITLDNSVWSWGYNGQGQLGIGTQQQQTSPSPVANFFAPESNGLPTMALLVQQMLRAQAYMESMLLR